MNKSIENLNNIKQIIILEPTKKSNMTNLDK